MSSIWSHVLMSIQGHSETPWTVFWSL